MESFTRVRGVAVAIPEHDISTDIILPAAWAIDGDFAKALFGNWRYHDSGEANPEFILNHSPYSGACILVAGRNFGCGSSREIAVFGLRAFGIRCVIAPSFGDIFRSNCLQNGLLPVTLEESVVDWLAESVATAAGTVDTTVDLSECTITAPSGEIISFDVEPAIRTRLLNGLDDLELSLQRDADITKFQARDELIRPWIHRLSRD